LLHSTSAAGLLTNARSIEIDKLTMRKLRSTISHLAVIGLAVTALLIATVVWILERVRGDTVTPFAEAPDEAAVSVTAMLDSDGPETTPTVVREAR
jgi:hypothetical protein